MNGRVVLLIGGIVLLGVFGGMLLFLSQHDSSSAESQQAEKISTVTPQKKEPSTTLKEYVDPAGFSISYPDDLSLINNEKDTKTYADMTFKANDIPGMIAILITETSVSTLDAWFSQNNIATVSGKTQKTTIGTLPAYEIMTGNKTERIAIDNNVLFRINVDSAQNKAYWTEAYKKIAESFAFVEQTTNEGEAATKQPRQSAVDATADVEFEGEEVVE